LEVVFFVLVTGIYCYFSFLSDSKLDFHKRTRESYPPETKLSPYFEKAQEVTIPS
jgi:hypothetical protein